MVHRGSKYSLKDLPKQISLTELDMKIISARCSGKSISSFQKEKLIEGFRSVASSCIVLYGFFPINNENQMALLVSEMYSYFTKMDFDHLNFPEYHLALQLNAKGNLKIPVGVDLDQVRASSNTLNVKFISDVMCLYLEMRNNLDRKLQNLIDGF